MASAPTVTTNSTVTSISTTGATLGGEITNINGADATIRGFEYSTSNGFAEGTGANDTDSGTFGNGTFTKALTGLTAGTTYYFKAKATNSAGTGYGAQQSFITVCDAPATPTSSSVTSTGFTATWSVTTGAGDYRLDVATDAGFTSFVSGYNDLTVAGTSQAISGLTASTTYYVRVRAVNAGGTSASSSTLTQATNSAASPTVTPSGSLSSVDTTYGTASASPTSFSITGSNLTGSITITPPAGFEISTQSDFSSNLGTNGSPLVVADSGGSIASTTLYVRIPANTVPGTYSGNIEITGGGLTSTVTIATASTAVAAKPLTVTGHSGINKTYDGLVTATAAGTGSLSGGLVGGDSVSLSGSPTWTFADAAVGAGKTVTASGYSLTGAEAARYSLTQPTVTAEITTAALTITADDVTKVAGVALTGGAGSTAFTSSGLQNGETIGSVTITYGDAALTTGNGTIPGTYTGQVTPSAATGGTFTASNYAISYVSGNITVTAAPVVIFTEGLNESTTYVTASGGTYLGGNSSDTTWPQNVDLFSEGSHSYRVSSGTGTITSTAIDTTYGSSMSLSFRLGAFAGSSGQGMETGDTVTLATSTDNGTTWSNEIQVTGNLNAYWAFSSGTGNASAAYDGNNSASVYTPSGTQGAKTTDGYSTVHLSGLPQAAQFRFRITAVNNAADERWHIDEIIFRGALPSVSVNTTSLTAFTATAGTASANQTFTVNGTYLVGDITVGPLTGFEFSTDGTTYSSSLTLARSGDAVADTTVHVRLAADAQLGSYDSQAITLASTGAITKTVTTAASGNAMSANPTDLTAFATAVTQNFNTLASSGNSSSMPTSWYFLETGSSGEVDGVYAANTGSSSTGNTYSMGAESDSDRALGSLRTGTIATASGVALRNTTGSTITSLRVAYTGETWRVGSSSRSDTIDFAYSTDASTLANGNWTDVDSLDYANPGNATTGGGSLRHSAAVAHTLTGLNIPDNAVFFLRWTDADASGSDDMMGIDDVSITPVAVPSVTTGSAASVSATGATINTSEVTSTGGDVLTARGVVYGTSPNPTLSDSVATEGGTSAGTFNTPLTGLTAGTTYHARAYATNGAGTSYGSEISFITLPAQAATPAGGTYLEAGTGFTASWSAVGSATGYRLDVATDAGFTSFVAGYNDLSVAGTSQAITGLAAGTTYYVRVRAENASGAGASSETLAVTTIPAAPVLARASAPTASGFTVNWGAVTGAANYTVLHSANKNMNSATSVDTDSTSLTLSVGTGLRYVQVRANNAAGSSANSTMQVNQLQSIAAGVTAYLGSPGVVGSGNATIAEKFGSANEAGLAAGGTPSNSTNIILLSANGSSQTGVYFNGSNWVRGADIVNTEEIPAGKAFMLKNNSLSTDYILLVGSPASGPRQAVALSTDTNFTLVTTGRTTPTPFTDFVASVTPMSTPTAATHFKASGVANLADQIIVPGEPGQPAKIYFYHPTAKGGASWMVNGLKITDPARPAGSDNIPTGAGIFIRKAGGSTLETFTPPEEE